MSKNYIFGIHIEHIKVKLPCYIIVDKYGNSKVCSEEQLSDEIINSSDSGKLNVIYLELEE